MTEVVRGWGNVRVEADCSDLNDITSFDDLNYYGYNKYVTCSNDN